MLTIKECIYLIKVIRNDKELFKEKCEGDRKRERR